MQLHAIQEPLPLQAPGLAPAVDEERRAREPQAAHLDARTEPAVDDDGLLRLAPLSRGELRGLFR